MGRVISTLGRLMMLDFKQRIEEASHEWREHNHPKHVCTDACETRLGPAQPPRQPTAAWRDFGKQAARRQKKKKAEG